MMARFGAGGRGAGGDAGKARDGDRRKGGRRDQMKQLRHYASPAKEPTAAK